MPKDPLAGLGFNNPLEKVKARAMNIEPVSKKFAGLPTHTLNPAEWTYKRLTKYIIDFESKLDDQHEIGARLVSFGSAVTFHIQDIGYHGPDIITFTGVNDDSENVQLIQNISQLSVLLVAMIKAGETPKRIGFQLEERMKETDRKNP